MTKTMILTGATFLALGVAGTMDHPGASRAFAQSAGTTAPGSTTDTPSGTQQRRRKANPSGTRPGASGQDQGGTTSSDRTTGSGTMSPGTGTTPATGTDQGTPGS